MTDDNVSQGQKPPAGEQSQYLGPPSEAPPQGLIEVDSNAEEPAYSESSTIMNYKWQNGRRYHAYLDGAYWGPNDEKQQDAEDLLHEVFRIVLDDRLYDAPLPDDMERVLDLGCGTGLWAIDFADENPDTEVVGVDLSPIQPTFVPPNCHFEVDDVNDEWTFGKSSFDFIHVRGMSGSIPDWVELHQKVLEHLKPGGWVQQLDISCIARTDDNTIRADSPLNTWTDLFKKMGDARGKTFLAPEIAYESIKAAGFENVTQRIFKLPIGTWPKDQQFKQWGAWTRQFLMQAIEGLSIRGLTDLLDWSFEEAQVFLAQIRRELNDPAVHSYMEMRVVHGQKPVDS